MKDHAAYLKEHADQIRAAGILAADSIDFYSDLFAYQRRFYERYRHDPRLPSLQQSDLPLADHIDSVIPGAAQAGLIIEGIAPLIEIIGAHQPGLDLNPFSEALAGGAEQLQSATGALLAMDHERLERFAASRRTGVDEAIFLMIHWLKPFFMSLMTGHRTMIPENDHAYQCPFCGYRPDMAVIVAGMDGKRYLHCALCEHRWQYRRIACAICGTEDAASLEYFSSDDESRYRIDACTVCGGYIKTVRMAKFEDIEECDFTVENIITPHLDSAAMKRGYQRP